MTPCVPYAVENAVCFSPIQDTRFNGFIGEYFDRFFQNRVLSDYAKETIFKEAEDALHYPHDDDTIVGMWSGEFWGKLEISACRVCEYTHDESLKKFVHDSAKRILSYARPDGYVNSYKDSANFLPPNPDETEKVVGWRCVWNWNIWCRKYTLWGLTECAVLTDDKEILDGAHKFALQLIHELKEKGVSLSDTGTASFHGVPSQSILKPMLILYRYTGDIELLDFGLKIAAEWENPDGKMPNIIQNALCGKPIHEWYDHSEEWAKAYETMSCLDGLIELYRITGINKYLNAVRYLYELLLEHESNTVGSVAFNDIFAHASAYQNSISEPCDVIHWIRMCTELFTLTGKECYMDSAEKAFYNTLIASISDDGTWGARGVRSGGRHFLAKGQSGCVYNHCCVDNIPRGFLNFTSSAVMTAGDEYYINQFCPFAYEDGARCVKITCHDGYLESGRVKIDIESDSALTLHLRVPSSAGTNAAVTVKGEKRAVRPGGYIELKTEPNHTQIEADFDFSAKVCDFTAPVDVDTYPDDDFRVRRWVGEYTPELNLPRSCMMSVPCSRITYGPLILARSEKLGASAEELFDFESVCGKKAKAVAVPKDRGDANVMCRFAVTVSAAGAETVYDMCDMGTACDCSEKADPKSFNIYL